MNTNLNDYLKDIMPTTQTVTAMDFGPFVSDYSFGCKNDETKPDRRGWKRRKVLEALRGMEIMSIRKMHEALKKKGIEVSTGTVANAIQTFILQNPTTERCLKPQHSVHTHDILRLLTEGNTIKEISKVLNISIRTIKNYIKKAKQEGLITNMGSKKYPKWTMISNLNSMV